MATGVGLSLSKLSVLSGLPQKRLFSTRILMISHIQAEL